MITERTAEGGVHHLREHTRTTCDHTRCTYQCSEVTCTQITDLVNDREITHTDIKILVDLFVSRELVQHDNLQGLVDYHDGFPIDSTRTSLPH